ncbi:serine hydrolase, partial [Halobacillus sp. BBL2006]|uniref:serine hydrolase domain-containing protein n=1 Tax=Halobacillus sp. BBL2006 TaxID=1543706 RepID=UPI000543693D
MRRRTLPVLFVTILGTSLLAPNPSLASQGPTIEKGGKVNVNQSSGQGHPVFTWDVPGPTSPVLHPGSVRGAGMRGEPLNEIDDVLKSAIDEKVMPGAVAFVARRGHVVKKEAYGYAVQYQDDAFTEVADPIPMNEDTIFDLASISKLFTTTAAMKLYEEGKFKLDDPFAKYIPEFSANGKESVTIEQLMTHTSGFKPWIPLYTVEGTREDRLQYVLQYPLQNKPGSEYTYSDLNMITLGALVERLSGMRLDQYVKKEITAPLGMDDTMYNPPESLKDRIAATEYQPWTDRGLVWGEVHDESAWSLDGVAGHAGVFSTASDLAKFAHMFLMDGKYGGTRILEPETIDLLTENRIPQFPGDDHGLGWELQQGWFMDGLSESTTLGHTGYTGTSIVVSPTNQ